MKIKEAIKILKDANKWRRRERCPWPDHKKFGEAIDFAIEAMEQFTKATQNGKIN